MKKIALALVALCAIALQVKADTDITARENCLYVASATVRTGTVYNLSIAMKNSASTQGYNLEVVVPTEFEIGTPVATLTRNATQVVYSNIVGDGIIRIAGTSTAGDVYTGNDGEVFQLPITIPATATVGTYTIKIQGSKIQGLGDLEDTETTITVTDVITLSENDTELPEDAENAKVKVVRTINANEWSTICLPFAMTEEQVAEAFGSDVQLADFTGYETDDDVTYIKVNFESVDAIEANHPYIIKVTEDVTEFTAEGVDIAAEEEPVVATVKRTRWVWSEFIGNYVAGTSVPEFTLFLSGGAFWYSLGNTSMKAFRGYFDFSDSLSDVKSEYSVKAISINLDGQATAVRDLNVVAPANGAIYNVAGQRVSKVQKGLYIVGGKKVLR